MNRMICLIFLFVAFSSNLMADEIVTCKGWGNEKTFELTGDLEESGSTYLDAFIDLKVIDRGVVLFQQNHIDTTGMYALSRLDGVQVYLAELRPIHIGLFDFLSIAANHPYPSGNSYLTFQGHQYLAECYLK